MTEERLSVPREAEGTRLDRFLAERSGGDPSRSRFARLIADGHVRVNGRAERPAYAVRAGDVIAVAAPPPAPSHLEPEAIPLAIVFEDEHVIVIDKPPGLVVHPGSGVRTGTLVHGLLHHTASLSRLGDPLRPGILHRLDKDTSGLVVVAKTESAHLHLARDLAARRVERAYGAVVWGRPPREGRVEAPIGRHQRDRKRMAVRDDGRAASTTYRVVETFAFASHLDVTLGTGRTHQIRVHMKHIGHPVFGDPQYGGRLGAAARFVPDARAAEARALLASMPRQALHARRLAFRHPVTGRDAVFESRWPSDIASLLEALRESAG
jgi:23S rRNA pseudouridine1911/1915/1917 synthase